jgi:sporulation protein YlmC with PRC-barrel domain
MRRHQKPERNKHVVSAIAVAGILSLGTAPVWAQQDSQSRQQGSQSRQQAGATDTMIASSALEDSQVLDQQNREVGKISNLYIDPKSGRVMRADIEFDSGLFGTGQRYSVAWDQLSVKRQNGEIVVALDQSVIQRVEKARNETSTRREGAYDRQQQTARRDGVLGMGENDSRRDQAHVSASQLSSNQIRKIQQELNKEGFHAGQVTGRWTSETQSAIKNFQQSKGLQPTGELNQRTLDELGLDADEFRQESQSGSGSGYSGGTDHGTTR